MTVIYGPLAIGVGLQTASTGFQARGRARPNLVICGRPDGGDIPTAATAIAITMATGAGTSATTVASITDTVTLAPAIRAVIGTETASTTTALPTM